MVRHVGVRIDLLKSRDSNISGPTAGTPGLSIDDPITDRLLSSSQIPIREMISPNDVVVVPRLRSRIEDCLHSRKPLPQRGSVQLSENASAEVLKGRPSRSRFHGLPRACWPLQVSRPLSAGTSTVQTP